MRTENRYLQMLEREPSLIALSPGFHTRVVTTDGPLAVHLGGIGEGDHVCR